MFLFGALSLLALAAIWGGYPLAVRLLGALRRESRPEPVGGHPSVSVIIASHDEAAAINARIDDELRSVYPANSIEVIIALDSARARSTVEELRSTDPHVTVLVGDAPRSRTA